jgi:translocation and assembly module TamB
LFALWHLLQPVLLMLLLLAVVGGAVAAAALWLLRSPEGTAWLLARVPGMQVEGVRGALLSEHFEIDRVLVQWDRQHQSVRIDGLKADGVQWVWHPARGAWLGLVARRARAQRVEVQTGPPGPRPITMPRSLQLPLRLQVATADLEELQIESLPIMRQLHADGVVLWEPGARGYHADAVRLDWDRAHIRGSISLAGLPPYALAVQAQASSLGTGPAWTAELGVSGPLADFSLTARLKGTAVRHAAAPSLDIDAQITPLDAWPLGRLRLQTRALDLSALSSRAPRTALNGRVDIDSQSRSGPFGADVLLDNSAPGLWSDGRVPARRLQARLRSPDADRQRLVIEQFDVLLADGSNDAGRWQGRGQWAGSQLQLDTRVDQLRPQHLDARAAGMTLTGPVELTLTGLPAPTPSALSVAAAGGSGSAPLSRQSANPSPNLNPNPKPSPTARAAPGALRLSALALALRATLDGQIDGSPQAVKLTLDGSADLQHLNLRELRAEAGAARALMAVNLSRRPGEAWALRSSGRLTDFDPVVWWPGTDGSDWRQGPHRLSGSWAVDLSLPWPQPSLEPLALLQAAVGSGAVHIDRSQLAGVPLTLHLDLANQPGQSATPSSVQGEWVLGGNRLKIDGRGNPGGNGRQDQLRFELQAGQLGTLAPIARLLPGAAAWLPRGGRAEASLEVDGRWPDVRSSGKAALHQLQLGSLEAREAKATWRFDTFSDQPLMIKVDALGVSQGRQRLDHLLAEMSGTLRQHRLEASAALPLSPPPTLQTLLGLRTAAGTVVDLTADGQWLADGQGGGRWSGQIARLTLGAWSGKGTQMAAGAGSRWLDADDLRAELGFDARNGLAEVRAAAGQVRLADAATLRWDDVQVDLRGTAPAFALRADIEPFALAPMLARTHPELGWAGDLRVGARVDMTVREQVDADITIERRDGDLTLTDETGTQAFGLSDLKLLASAHDGQWHVAGAFAGKTIGEAAGRLNLRVRPNQRWPTADTPIDGLIEAHVANLGIWGNWVPPGWRLSGELRTSAAVTGQLGAPDYTGEIRANQVAVRNLLLGVDVRDGQAVLKLKGPNAEIERFTLQGGDGRVVVTGSAKLAGSPSATVRLEADHFRALGRIDRQLTASGALDVKLTSELMRIDGKVRVDEGLFDLGRSDAPTLDEDVTIRQAKAPARDQPPSALAARPRRAQQVAIDLDLGDKLRVRGRGLDSTLSGQVRLGTTARKLTVQGIVTATNGTYAAYGQKLDIERGVIIFSGEPDNPVLDVLTVRPDLDFQVGVAITGPLQSPRVRLYASSDMSDSDKLSWLVLGRASDGLGRADTALLQRAAVALLAGEGEAPTDTLLRNLGIDQLSVRQSDTDVRETVVSLGKQLSRRWYVGYERGVNATAGTWQLIYRIAQRFTLRAQSGLENSLDLIWVWRVEEHPSPVFEPAPPAPAPAASSAPAPVPKSTGSVPP